MYNFVARTVPYIFGKDREIIQDHPIFDRHNDIMIRFGTILKQERAERREGTDRDGAAMYV